VRHPRIKFCGLTRAEDVRDAVEQGADAVGFVLTRRSRRFVEPVAARALRDLLPPFVSAVVLAMDDEAAWLRHAIDIVRPDLLQFHGGEEAAYCEGFGRPYIKAVPMASTGDLAAFATRHPQAAGFLLDSHADGQPGGSGRTFDWSRLPAAFDRPLVLAGGLRPDNVAEAIRMLRPWAVDVSSGIESAPGIKHPGLMRAFVAAVMASELPTE